jgi:Fe2+ transport system protein FeoA
MSVKNHVNLSSVSAGSKYRIKRIQLPPETNQRLRELGFNENAIIRTIIKDSSKLICEINNTRVGIHQIIADDIFVSPL